MSPGAAASRRALRCEPPPGLLHPVSMQVAQLYEQESA